MKMIWIDGKFWFCRSIYWFELLQEITEALWVFVELSHVWFAKINIQITLENSDNCVVL